MRRILFVASTFSHITNFHLPYLQSFVDRGCIVDVACAGTPPELPLANQVISVPLKKSMFSPKNLAAVWQLRKLMKENHYDMVSCHTALASFFLRLAIMSLRHRPKVVCTCHGYLFDQDTSLMKRTLLSWAECITAPVTDLLLTMNQWDTQYALQHKLGKQVAYIPGMGLDPDRLPIAHPQQAQQLRKQLKLPENAFVLLFAGELSRRKSQDVLLRALTHLPESVYLLLPGQGDEGDTYVTLAQTLGVAHRVRFPGHISHMSLWYAAADVVVSASRIEGLPFNLMEAMYYGIPIVASDVKGQHDLLAPQQAGLLYPYGDSHACAQRILTLLHNHDLLRQLGGRAQHAVTPYLLSNAKPKILEQYEPLLPQEGILAL